MNKQELLDSESVITQCLCYTQIILGIEANRDDSFPFELS